MLVGSKRSGAGLLTVWNRIGIGCIACVPVVWNALVAGSPYGLHRVSALIPSQFDEELLGTTYVTVGARDRHEALQYILVQDTFRIFCRLIRHESIDEGEGGLRDCHAGERAI